MKKKLNKKRSNSAVRYNSITINKTLFFFLILYQHNEFDDFLPKETATGKNNKNLDLCMLYSYVKCIHIFKCLTCMYNIFSCS